MKLTDKYVFRPYNKDFPKLFNQEKIRLQSKLGSDLRIEHIGSTAVPGLGGKGIIDILIVPPKAKWSEVSLQLKSAGYEYKKDAGRENNRLFFMAHLPDKELGSRLYHVHLSYPGSSELANSVGFRDFLRSHPDKLIEYADIKKRAAMEAQKMSSKDEMGDTYADIKRKFIEKIMSEI